MSLISKIKFELKVFREQAESSVSFWIARLMPSRVVTSVCARVGAHATTGKFGKTNIADLKFMEAMERWDEPNV